MKKIIIFLFIIIWLILILPSFVLTQTPIVRSEDIEKEIEVTKKVATKKVATKKVTIEKVAKKVPAKKVAAEKTVDEKRRKTEVKKKNLNASTQNNATRQPIVAKDKAAQERKAWDLVKNSSSASDFRYFLEEFPNGDNAAKAKIRLEELVWQSVRGSDKTKIQAYLKEFPNGANAAAARIRLKQLDTAGTTTSPSTKNQNTSANRTAGAITKVTLSGNIEMSFAYISAGEFQMGSINGDSNEKPVHTVRISRGFWMQQTEVTQAQWKAMMGTLLSKCSSGGSLSGDFLGDNKPISCVSWEDAQQFIAKMNAQNDGYKYRLPTEAEWEYAARAGTTSNYAGDLDSMAWYAKNWDKHSHEVATKQANSWGLYDMHGNVSEWVQDLYGDYSSEKVTDPTGADSGLLRVIRGGAWDDVAGDLRSAYRSNSSPSGRYGGLGFRILRE